MIKGSGGESRGVREREKWRENARGSRLREEEREGEGEERAKPRGS